MFTLKIISIDIYFILQFREGSMKARKNQKEPWVRVTSGQGKLPDFPDTRLQHWLWA